MASPQNLIVFHYHLLRGGVRTALLRSLQCLAHEGWATGRRITLAVGRADGARSFARTLATLVPDVSVIVDPRLDYREEPWPDAASFSQDVRALRDAMLSWAGGSALFWLHNPTLGKNAAVTAAWRDAARRAWADGLDCRFLYHIHDFPECGRTANMERLRNCWNQGGLVDLYPAVPNTAYAVLNSRDRNRLVRCGLPPERVFWLPNVLIPSSSPPAPLQDTRRKAMEAALANYALAHAYLFDPSRPRWLLPIRLIRRKNVMEALLLSALTPEAPQLLVTLDATSAQEKPYAEALKQFVRHKRLPCVIGFGTELVGTAFSFEELMMFCDAVVTTSLLEGFGFAFLEGPLQGRPLLGRNLPDVTADFAAVGFPSHRLYDTLPVPLQDRHRIRLLDKGRRFAARYAKIVRTLSREDLDRFTSRLEAVYGGASVDFGMLDFEAQRDLVGEALIGGLDGVFPESMEPVRMDEEASRAFFARFGPTAHARRLTDAFNALWAADRTTQEDRPARGEIEGEPDVNACVSALFFDPVYQRPLFGGW
ncbi:MAG: hypothetical protein WHS86_05960 [Desulfosoma sp.]